jgi:hypothetical protein
MSVNDTNLSVCKLLSSTVLINSFEKHFLCHNVLYNISRTAEFCLIIINYSMFSHIWCEYCYPQNSRIVQRARLYGSCIVHTVRNSYVSTAHTMWMLCRPIASLY